MKHNITIIIFFLSLSLKTKAQNLVYNGDFEIYATCPNNQGQIANANGWTSAGGTPDYFNYCTSYIAISIPYNALGYQNDYLKKTAYSGLYAFNKGFPNNGREYIQAYLTDTLKTGRKYLATMYINECNEWNYAVATLGMYFTSSAIQASGSFDLINISSPQIKSSILLNDTVNWLMIQDTIGGNGETYLTIGNFSYDSLSDTVKVYHAGFGTSNDYAYYYIDGVSVYDVTGGVCNNLWDAGFNLYIAAGDSIELGAINTDGSTFTWLNSAGGNTYLNNNNDARPWAQPTVTTTYYVTKTCPNNNVFIDTITVYVQQLAGIKQVSGNVETSIYPNPANNKIIVVAKDIAEIKLFDILGNQILSTKQKEIDVSNLTDGVYFIQVKTKQNSYTQKIIIQH